jgi:hypothetical protein
MRGWLTLSSLKEAVLADYINAVETREDQCRRGRGLANLERFQKFSGCFRPTSGLLWHTMVMVKLR